MSQGYAQINHYNFIRRWTMANGRKSSNITHDSTYRGYKINNPKKHSEGCYIDCLDTIIDTIEDMTEKHSKVLVTRVDIRKPQDQEINNSDRKFTRILEGFKREQERKTKDSKHSPDLRIVRTTERMAKDRHTHNHLFIVANGNILNNGYLLSKSLERHTERIFQSDNNGLVHLCASTGSAGLMINRNKEDSEVKKAKAVYAGSYLAKVRGKELTPKGTHRLSCTRKKK